MRRLVRGIRYDLWVVFAVVCGMLLHAPSMSARAEAPGAIPIAAAMHIGHDHGSGGIEEERCCAICSPAACGLGPLPAQMAPETARAVKTVHWVSRAALVAARFNHHWPSPRGPPLHG